MRAAQSERWARRFLGRARAERSNARQATSRASRRGKTTAHNGGGRPRPFVVARTEARRGDFSRPSGKTQELTASIVTGERSGNAGRVSARCRVDECRIREVAARVDTRCRKVTGASNAQRGRQRRPAEAGLRCEAVEMANSNRPPGGQRGRSPTTNCFLALLPWGCGEAGTTSGHHLPGGIPGRLPGQAAGLPPLPW